VAGLKRDARRQWTTLSDPLGDGLAVAVSVSDPATPTMNVLALGEAIAGAWFTTSVSSPRRS
jgi:hypothetical protein